jgi:hypothetical protein
LFHRIRHSKPSSEGDCRRPSSGLRFRKGKRNRFISI